MAVKGMYFLNTGDNHYNSAMEVYGADRNKVSREQIFAALLDTDDGYILYDTGFPADDERLFQPIPTVSTPAYPKGVQWVGDNDYRVDTANDIRDCLKERGLTPDDMKYVIISHFHWDHVGGVKFFKNSKIIVHKDALSYAKWPDQFFDNNWKPNDMWNLDAMGLNYEVVLGDKLIAPGVMVMDTPGHAFGHLSLIVNCPKDGQIILAGDLFHAWDNWEKRLPMDDMNFATHDPQAWFKSWDRIKAYADMNNARVIPSHDYKYLHSIPWEYH